MEQELEMVRQARESFDRILHHKVYTDVIRDDRHLSLLLELVQGGSYKRILDIGTGTGYLAIPLAKAYPEALVYGIDIAESIIDKNKECAKKSGMTNLIFRSFDGIFYPFEEMFGCCTSITDRRNITGETCDRHTEENFAGFDLIVSRYAFHHFPNPENAVEQIYRLLTFGGKVLISDPVRAKEDRDGIIDSFMRIKKDGHIRFYAETELEQMFAGKGMQKGKQVFSQMAFPFAPERAYTELYEKLTDEDRQLYDIAEENGTIWVRNIAVGNTVFEKNKIAG